MKSAKPRIQVTEVDNDLNSGRLHLGDGVFVYRRITVAGIHRPSGFRLTVEVEVDTAGNPHCRAISFASDPAAKTWDDDVTTDSIRRVPIGEVVHQCFAAAQFALEEVQDDGNQHGDGEKLYRRRELTDEERAIAHPKGVARSKRRKPLSRDELRLIAKRYTEAAAHGENPTRLLADRFNVNRSTARRWVQRAEAEGFLEHRLTPAEGARRPRRRE